MTNEKLKRLLLPKKEDVYSAKHEEQACKFIGFNHCRKIIKQNIDILELDEEKVAKVIFIQSFKRNDPNVTKGDIEMAWNADDEVFVNCRKISYDNAKAIVSAFKNGDIIKNG